MPRASRLLVLWRKAWHTDPAKGVVLSCVVREGPSAVHGRAVDFVIRPEEYESMLNVVVPALTPELDWDDLRLLGMSERRKHLARALRILADKMEEEA